MITMRQLKAARQSDNPGMDVIILDTDGARYCAVFCVDLPDDLYVLKWKRKGSSMEPEERKGLRDLNAVLALINEMEGFTSCQ